MWELKTAFFEVYEKFINMKDKREMLNRCHSLKLKATQKAEEKILLEKLDKTNSMSALQSEHTDDNAATCACHGNV
jgi:uncharacterized protein YktA (UPF0223 family)